VRQVADDAVDCEVVNQNSVGRRHRARILADGYAAPRNREPTEETPEAAEPKPEGLDALLPFLTEGGVAMLLGIGFGMATRAIFKLFMIGLLVLFAAVQYLSMKGILTVDWGAMGQWLNDFVLNVKERWGVAELIQYKLPSMGSFGLGFYLGLKRG